MGFVKNFDALASTPQRKIVLELVEAAFQSIQPDHVMDKEFKLDGNMLSIGSSYSSSEEQSDESRSSSDSSPQGRTVFNLDEFDRIFLIGFGKGSAGISKIIENQLGDKLTEGHVIDTTPETFQKIHFTQGSHPNISTLNLAFTQALLKRLATLQLTEKDLVLVVVCGGGSALFEAPYAIPIEKEIEVGKALLSSGADIIEMNKVRQHLSEVKGGGLAERLYPARVASMIFSDVPGNDLTYIASGPTVHDPTHIEDAKVILRKYNLEEKLALPDNAFLDNPQDKKYFENVSNIIVLSNLTALNAMKSKAQELGIEANISSDKFQSEAKEAGKKLLEETNPGSILLAGGETTVKVSSDKKGGRNQEVVLGALPYLGLENEIVCSFDSDGWDNTEFAGALGDHETKKKAAELQLDMQTYLQENNSFEFFEKTGDGIITGRLPSNVSDLFVVFKDKKKESVQVDISEINQVPIQTGTYAYASEESK